MKKTIKFEKVHTSASGRIRVYKASQPLSKKANGKVYRDGPETAKMYANKEKTETKDIEFSNIFDCVVVSDAHTHIERLAFPAWEYEPIVKPNSCPYFWQTDTIAGVNTFMIHGGDSRTVKPDGVYLRMIAKANGYQMEKMR